MARLAPEVNDKVLVAHLPDEIADGRVKIGDTGKVVELDTHDEYPYLVDFNGWRIWLREGDVELVAPPDPSPGAILEVKTPEHTRAVTVLPVVVRGENLLGVQAEDGTVFLLDAESSRGLRPFLGLL